MRTFGRHHLLLVLLVGATSSMMTRPPCARAQAPPTITYPPQNTAAPAFAVPPNAAAPTFAAPPNAAAPAFAAPPAGAPVQFDPYSMPATGPTLPPTLPPATLPPGAAPQISGTPYPAQLPQQPLLPWMNSPKQPPVGAQPRRGFFGGFEGAVLEPKVGAIRVSRALTPILLPPDQAEAFRLVTNSTDYDLTFSPRVWAGYMGRQGFGGRVTWWYFDADSKVSSTTIDALGAAAQTSLRYNVFDFEATQLGAFQNWQVEFSGGVRYARNDQSLNVLLEEDELTGSVRIAERFEGVGPTISVQFKRPLGSWEGLTFIGKSRYSLLFGNIDLSTDISGDFDIPDLGILQVGDSTITSWEIQIGAAWTRILRSGAVLNLGGFLEGQVWNPDSLGFFGPTFRASISR